MSSSLQLLDGLMSDEDTDTDTPDDQDPDRPSDDDDDEDDSHPAETDDEGDGQSDEDEGEEEESDSDEDDDPFAEDGDGDDAEEDLASKLTVLGKDGKPKQVTLDEALRGKQFVVKVDGEIQQVGFDELRKGYIRQSTFSRRTEDLAAERRKLEGERGAILDQARTEAGERVQALEDQIKTVDALFGTEPDWLAVSNKVDHKELTRLQLNWQNMQRTVAAAKAKVTKEREEAEAKATKAQEDAAKEAEDNRAKNLEANRGKLLSLIPEWKDQKRATREINAIQAYLEDQGIDPAVIVDGLASNPNWVKIFRAAAAFERRKDAPSKLRDKKVVRKTKTQRAGAASPGLIAKEQERKRSQDRQSALRTGDKKTRRALMEKELGSFL